MSVESEKSFQEELKAGIACVGANELTEAMAHYQCALRYAERFTEMSAVFCYIGSCHRHMGEYDQAEKAYNAAADYAGKSGDPVSLAMAANEIGNDRLVRGKYKEALRFFGRAVSSIQKAVPMNVGEAKDITLREQMYSNNSGLVCRLMGHPKISEGFYNKALFISDSPHGDLLEKSRTLQELGVLEMERGNFKEAAGYLSSAFQIREQNNNTKGLWFVVDCAAVLAARCGKKEQAKELFAIVLQAPMTPMPHHLAWRDKAIADAELTIAQNGQPDLEKAGQLAKGILSEISTQPPRPASETKPGLSGEKLTKG